MFVMLMLASAWAEEPKKEIMFATGTSSSTGYSSLGVDEFSEGQVSFAYRIQPNISAVAAWSMGIIETDYSISSENTDRWDYFQSRFDRHQLMLGGRYDKPLNSWLRVYGHLGGTAAYNALLFQDDIEIDDPVTKQSSSSIQLGAMAGLGVLGSLTVKEDFPLLLFSFELGYSLQSQALLSEDIGTFDLSGRYTRVGVGVAF